MNIIKIAKGDGRYRTIYQPDEDERRLLNQHKPELRELQERLLSDAVHGFRVGRSPVTNAMPHCNKDWTLSMDLKDFFDSISHRHLVGLLPPHMIAEVKDGGVLYHGAPRQGLPTSPFVANIGASKMDEDILAAVGDEVVYTRYADDLSFSWLGDRSKHEWLRECVSAIVQQHGFSLAAGKTHLRSAAAGRRVVCGVAIDNDIHASRRVRRKLRAALHQLPAAQRSYELAKTLSTVHWPFSASRAALRVQGLQAWCSMRLPKP